MPVNKGGIYQASYFDPSKGTHFYPGGENNSSSHFYPPGANSSSTGDVWINEAGAVVQMPNGDAQSKPTETTPKPAPVKKTFSGFSIKESPAHIPKVASPEYSNDLLEWAVMGQQTKEVDEDDQDSERRDSNDFHDVAKALVSAADLVEAEEILRSDSTSSDPTKNAPPPADSDDVAFPVASSSPIATAVPPNNDDPPKGEDAPWAVQDEVLVDLERTEQHMERWGDDGADVEDWQPLKQEQADEVAKIEADDAQEEQEDPEQQDVEEVEPKIEDKSNGEVEVYQERQDSDENHKDDYVVVADYNIGKTHLDRVESLKQRVSVLDLDDIPNDYEEPPKAPNPMVDETPGGLPAHDHENVALDRRGNRDLLYDSKLANKGMLSEDMLINSGEG